MRLLFSSVLALVLLNAVPASAMPPPLQITIESGAPYFLPAEITVRTGARLQWKNPTPAYHTITHDACVMAEPCLFDSGSIAPDKSYTLQGLTPGRYPYHCRLHPIMRGIVKVVDAMQPSLN
jgi:plastocyanin